MTANTPAQKSNQAAVMASTGTKINDQVKSFDRYLAMVSGQLCEHGAKNGHITPEAAVRCGQAMAEAELATLPPTVDMDARLAAVAITVVTQDRFQCSKGCPFGHKTQGQAQACSQGSQAKAARQVRASIPVSMGGKLASLTQPTQATQESTQEPTQAKQEPTQATQPTQAKKSSLKASQGGNTSRA